MSDKQCILVQEKIPSILRNPNVQSQALVTTLAWNLTGYVAYIGTISTCSNTAVTCKCNYHFSSITSTILVLNMNKILNYLDCI